MPAINSKTDSRFCSCWRSKIVHGALRSMRPYSLYLSIVEGYATTVITLESLFRQPMEFQKCIIIASGTTDPRLLTLLEQIRTRGYLSYPPEKFLVIIQSLEESMGAGEAWNLAMSFTTGEDLFY